MLNGMLSMSSDLSDRQWRFYVDDMLGFCDRVLRSDIPALQSALRDINAAP
jgi:hypothetical protein